MARGRFPYSVTAGRLYEWLIHLRKFHLVFENVLEKNIMGSNNFYNSSPQRTSSNILQWLVATPYMNHLKILSGRVTWKFCPLLVSVNMEHVFEGFSGESMATLRIQVHQTPPPICVNMERFTGAPSDIRHLNSLTFWVVRLTWNLPARLSMLKVSKFLC